MKRKLFSESFFTGKIIMLNTIGRYHRGFSARIRNGRALACAIKPVFEVLEARRLFSGLPVNGNGGDLTAITSFGSVVTNGPALQGPEPFPFAGGQVKNELVQPDGKRVVAGHFNGNVAVARYNVDGTLDASFGGGDGKSVNDLGTSGDRALNMNLRPDGKIVLLGVTAGSGDAWQFAAIRLNSNGTLDSTFADNGKLFSGLGRAPTYGGVSVILADGRIHMTGWDGSVSKAMAFDADGKNGFDRLAGGSGAGLRAGSIPVAARAQEGTLQYFAQGGSVGPDEPETMAMHAQANPSVNEGSDYALSLSMGGWVDDQVGPSGWADGNDHRSSIRLCACVPRWSGDAHDHGDFEIDLSSGERGAGPGDDQAGNRSRCNHFGVGDDAGSEG